MMKQDMGISGRLRITAATSHAVSVLSSSVPFPVREAPQPEMLMGWQIHYSSSASLYSVSEAVKQLARKRSIDGKMVLKETYDADGSTDKYKASCVGL